jgi:predicted esterase
MIESHAIAVQTHGRYLLVPGSERSWFLVGFHGYAQNAGAMLSNLQRIPRVSRWTLVSIQGLHRFYNRQNDVVASWMTREDRDAAIDDNVRYVDAVVDEVARQCGEPRRLVFAGFSQGVAMAYRAAARGRRTPHGVIVLAGDVPPELVTAGTRMPRVLIGRGMKDSWYNEQKMNGDLLALEKIGAGAETFVFDGAHEWTKEFASTAERFLSTLENE